MNQKDSNNNGIQNAFKAGIWYTISTLVVRSISIISTPAYTRMMSKADYGISGTFNTWYSLLAIICSLNVGYSIGRAKVDFGDQFDKYIGSLQILCIVITTFIFIPIFAFIRPIESFAGIDKKSILLLFFYLLFGTVVSIYQGKYRFRYEYKQNIIVSIFISISTVLFSLLFIWILPEKYLGKIIGTVIPPVILGIVFWIISIKRNYISFNKEYIRYAIVFSAPLIIHSISIYILGQSDRLMVKHYCGDSEAGVYTLIYQYAILVSLFTNSVNQAWNPWFHDNYALKNFSIIKKKVVPLLILGAFVGCGCVAIAPEAVRVLGGTDYLEGLSTVLPIVLGVIAEFFYTQYVIIEMHLKKTKWVSIGTVIAALINLLLNWIFIPKFGYIAAAYTTLFSYLLLLGIHYLITRIVLRVKLYNDLITIIIFLMASLLCFGFSALYDLVFIRYILLSALIILFGIYNKDFIIKKIKKGKTTNDKVQ